MVPVSFPQLLRVLASSDLPDRIKRYVTQSLLEGEEQLRDTQVMATREHGRRREGKYLGVDRSLLTNLVRSDEVVLTRTWASCAWASCARAVHARRRTSEWIVSLGFTRTRTDSTIKYE